MRDLFCCLMGMDFCCWLTADTPELRLATPLIGDLSGGPIKELSAGGVNMLP
jgi:hypothetical protein